MNIQGHFTAKGLNLAAKLSAGSTLAIARVEAGSGVTQDPSKATSLPQSRQTLAVNTAFHSGSTATLPVVLAAALAQESYTLTELGVYAKDPDEGEILYKIYQLDEPVAITAGSRMVLRFYLGETVSEDVRVNVTCSPDGLITEMDFLPVREKVMAAAIPTRNVSLSAEELEPYLDSLPKLLTENLVITVAGQDSRTLEINRFAGPGSLTITAAALEDCTFSGIYIGNCTAQIYLKTLNVQNTAAVSGNPYGLITITESNRVKLDDCSISAANQNAVTGVVIGENSLVNIGNTSMKNLYTGVFAKNNAYVAVKGGSTAVFSGNSRGVQVYNSGVVLLGGNAPNTLGGASNVNNGGLIVSAAGAVL